MTNSMDAQALQRQFDWAEKTFGPGSRLYGIIDHIKKELVEIEKDPGDIFEWIDLIHLAVDGARRETGATPQGIIDAYLEKLTINENRKWPDWRTAETGKAIEHIR